MNTKKLALITGFALCSAVSHAGIKEGGGWAKSETVYECTETNPKDPSNPMQAILTSELGDALLLRVGQKLNDPFEVQMVYSNMMTQNKAIMCLVACDIYENLQDETTFGLTLLDPEHGRIDGHFSGLPETGFTCTKPVEQ